MAQKVTARSTNRTTHPLALKPGRTVQSKGFSKSETEASVQLSARRYANAIFAKKDIPKTARTVCQVFK